MSYVFTTPEFFCLGKLCQDDDGSVDKAGTITKCEAWSWTQSALANGAPANRCHLKDLSKAKKVISKKDVVSGIEGACCAQKGVDYAGNDGDMQENVSSWQECGKDTI